MTRPTKTFKQAVREFKESYLRSMMQRTRGNISAAARLAKYNRTDLTRMLAKMNIDPNDYRKTNRCYAGVRVDPKR